MSSAGGCPSWQAMVSMRTSIVPPGPCPPPADTPGTSPAATTAQATASFQDFAGSLPQTLAAWVRRHWHIENKLHWVRDVTYQEDKSLVRTGNAPRVMASLRSLAISIPRLDGHTNIPAANRHHARGPQRTLKLLQAA